VYEKEKMEAHVQAWEERVLKPALAIVGERMSSFESRSGLPIERVYGPEKSNAEKFSSDIGMPGEYPYTRGISPLGYREKLWVMGQYSGFGTAEDTNRRFKYLIEQGQTGFSIALDLPTQIGWDSDDPMAEGEVGKVGVAIDTLDDFERLMDGIDLSKVRQIRTLANCIGPIMAAMFIGLAHKRGVDPNSFSVLFQNDSIKEYPARGTWIFPPSAALKLSCDVIEYTARHLPNWNPLQFCGAHYRESGATAVQELAFAFAGAIAYIEETRRRGLEIDDFAGSFYLFVYVHTDFLEEVAKLRAGRRIWAKLMKERYCCKNEDTAKLNIFVWVGGSSLTAQQPLNNIVRVAIQALAAVMGGVQTLAAASYDEGRAIPSEQAAMVALRTQQIVAFESGVPNTVDPLGGSFAIEALTDKFEEEVMIELAKIEAIGGATVAVDEGYFTDSLTESSFQWHQKVERKEKTVVGVNEFIVEEENETEIFLADPTVEKRQRERLQEVRERRDARQVEATLAAVRAAAERGDNLIPTLVEAVEAYASIGEICAELRLVYGEYRQVG
jgi:methylmalonyl-CoA mutase N-terminal domain/subunit